MMGALLVLYKISLYSKDKDATIKNLRLKILFFTFTHHKILNPFTPNTSHLAHSFTELKDLCPNHIYD